MSENDSEINNQSINSVLDDTATIGSKNDPKPTNKRENLDAFILPVASFPPKLNGDRNVSPPGATTWIASGLHWPAAVVPMGYTYEDLPSGLQIVGKPWSEITLIEIGGPYKFRTLAPPRKIFCLV